MFRGRRKRRVSNFVDFVVSVTSRDVPLRSGPSASASPGKPRGAARRIAQTLNPPMRNLRLLACLLIVCVPLHAAPPKRESVEKLLVVTEVEKLLTSMQQQIDGVMKNAMNEAFRGQQMTPEAAALSERLQKKLMANFRSELSWEKMKDLYIRVYSETFTQEEIDGLLEFYVSPAGKAFVAKMPMVMQKTMSLMQERMAPMMENTQRSIQEAVQEVDTLQKKKKG
jgi:uncharacterized protein